MTQILDIFSIKLVLVHMAAEYHQAASQYLRQSLILYVLIFAEGT